MVHRALCSSSDDPDDLVLLIRGLILYPMLTVTEPVRGLRSTPGGVGGHGGTRRRMLRNRQEYAEARTEDS